jgi:uncharacterized glyoxalase superfamily protein PhnB
MGIRFCLDVEGVAGFRARAAEAGAAIVRELEVRPWGMREFTMRDPNGCVMTYAEPAGVSG